MVRKAKPGPKSLLEKHVAPKGAGLKARTIHRFVTEIQSESARSQARKGFNAMWRFAPDLMRKWKVPKVGEFQKTNLHGGRLWGSYTEWHRKPITARRIALIFEKCALNTKCSDAVLKQISKTLSYLYLLETGVPKSNWPSLPGLKITLAKRKKIRQQQTVKPLDVPTGHQLAYAFTREWRENKDGWSLLRFILASVCAWDSHVLGSRPKSDLNKIKKSTCHWFGDDCWSTALVEGRSKLPLGKAGTRPWCAYRVCLCPNGKHVPPEPGLCHQFNDEGNLQDPTKYTTTCPLFAGQLLKQFQEAAGYEDFKLYRKTMVGKKRTAKGRSLIGQANILNVEKEAIEWLQFQGVHPVSNNSGRKCLAAWLSVTKCPYHESFQIMADLESVWQACYQPDLPPDGFKCREQSRSLPVATAAIRRFQNLCGRSPPPQPPPMSKTDQILKVICSKLGLNKSFEKVWKS